jgi:RluA family pseudouridine synthase
MLSLTVPETLAGRRVKNLLQTQFRIPAGMIARLKLRETGIRLNGARCRTTDTVRAGDVLTAEVGDLPAETGVVPIPVPLAHLYEDEDLLVLDKPAGMATHGRAERGDATVAAALAADWGTDRAFHPVTRLDRGTSGLLVVAKSGYAHERLRRILHTDAFRRDYLAITEGVPPAQRGSVTLPLKKDETAKNRWRTAPDGVAACTDYEVLAAAGGRGLLRLTLRTGRTHQIRVHLAAIGCPLVGDRVYGTAAGLDRPALHSAFLHLVQPVTGAVIDLTCPLPADMAALAADSGLI